MEHTPTAHIIQQKSRTTDVIGQESVDFDSLLLSSQVLLGLTKSGFHRPSPIQLKAIPLGRCGLDLVVQAKSGTGKTCVFSVIALESILQESSTIQVLVLAPTREIAVQIWQVVNAIGSEMDQLRCYTFIGGLPLAEDRKKVKKCHIAIGTPGRLKQLIEEGSLVTSNIRLFVLDEADKLMEENFQDVINWIYSSLPDNKQMLALSATYPEVLAQHLTAYMRNPTFVRLNSSDPALLGIRQYYKLVKFHPLPHQAFEGKVKHLFELLSSVAFNQCLVFSNYQLRAQSLSDVLNSKGWPATYISGRQDQEHRLDAMAKLKLFQCRVLISTDLTARGIDAENVNLVVNLDIPRDHETYLHRIGRAGRFGTYGSAVTFASHGKEVEELHKIEELCNTSIKQLPSPIPVDLAKSSGYVNIDHLVTTEQIMTKPDEDNLKAKVKRKTDLSASVEKQKHPTKSHINGNHSGNINGGLSAKKCQKEGDDSGRENSGSETVVSKISTASNGQDSIDSKIDKKQSAENEKPSAVIPREEQTYAEKKLDDLGEVKMLLVTNKICEKNNQKIESYQEVVEDYEAFIKGQSIDIAEPSYTLKGLQKTTLNEYNDKDLTAFIKELQIDLSRSTVTDIQNVKVDPPLGAQNEAEEKPNLQRQCSKLSTDESVSQNEQSLESGKPTRPKPAKEKNYKNSPRSLGYYIEQCKDKPFPGKEFLKDANKVDCPVKVKSSKNPTSQGKSLISQLAVHSEDLTDSESFTSYSSSYTDDSSYTSEEFDTQYADYTHQLQSEAKSKDMVPNSAGNQVDYCWDTFSENPHVFSSYHASHPRDNQKEEIDKNGPSSYANHKKSSQNITDNMEHLHWGQGDFNNLNTPDPFHQYQIFHQQYLVHLQWAQYYKGQCERMNQDQRFRDTLEAQKSYIHEMSKWYNIAK